MRILKYLITGCVGLTVNLGSYHLLTRAAVPYLAGSIIAFSLALVVGFLLQKYWTFDDRSGDRLSTQFFLYGSVALTNLAINTLIVFLLVERHQMHPLVAQAFGAAIVALMSYFIYRSYIFTDTLNRDKTIAE